MMWNIHGPSQYGNIDLNPATIGDNTIIAANAAGQNFLKALSIVVDAATVIVFKNTTTSSIATFKLQAFQTISLSDLPGQEGEPYYVFEKNQPFIINSTAAVRITGTYTYAVKN